MHFFISFRLFVVVIGRKAGSFFAHTGDLPDDEAAQRGVGDEEQRAQPSGVLGIGRHGGALLDEIHVLDRGPGLVGNGLACAWGVAKDEEDGDT